MSDVVTVYVPAARFVNTLLLGDRGIAARAVPRHRAWTAAPVGNYVLAAAVLVAGAGVGTAVGALLFWPSPVLALLLTLTAAQAAARPVAGASGARNRGVRLPVALRAKVVSALAELPPGTGRALLGRLVRRAAALLGAATPPVPAVAQSIEAMVTAACGAALELVRLEHAHDRAQSDEVEARSDSAEDKLVQRLLDADAALGRLQSGLAAEADLELHAVTAELEREAKIQAQAAEDVRALLRSS